MYLPEKASRARAREAENARKNRAEVHRALSTGQVSRRELMKWGILTSSGALASVNGLSPFADSAYAAVPTGTPRSPLTGVVPFSKALPRLELQQPIPLSASGTGPATEVSFQGAAYEDELPARRLSYHTEFTANGTFVNPRTNFGPLDGRPPGEYFAHQRWDQFLPQEGYIMTLGRLEDNYSCFADALPPQGADKIWAFAAGRNERCHSTPPLIKARYGHPVLFRHYNALPTDRYQNGGFGSISQATHNHNGHNASASDGASNAHFFPGQFFDYHWSLCLARHDMVPAGDRRASGPDGNGGLTLVDGDYRELQSSLWFHDHRFFYTAENVYKGHLGMLNYYSGPDRGHEALDDGVNLRLPSGKLLDWGNIDFDVNLILSDAALDQGQQLFFDIFDSAGFLGDVPLVNHVYKPYMEVLPRKYRFRILSASMSRWFKLALVSGSKVVPVTVIANDGNLLPTPVKVNQMDVLGTAERIDIVVDFSTFNQGTKLKLVNLLKFVNGTGPDKALTIADALKGTQADPVVGPILEFRVVNEVDSVDVQGYRYKRGVDFDYSQVPTRLTNQIPVVTPVRERIIEYKGTDSGESPEFGACFPDCGEQQQQEGFPWTMRINGETSNFLNANRVSVLIPKPGEVEHWTLVNGSGGSWDHPIHLHFEEGVTINRGGRAIPATEKLARKDVWRLGAGGRVKIQVRFGEFGGAYVNHCHNTVHEDWGMLMRYDILTEQGKANQSQTHVSVIPTPNPTPGGVTYRTPEILKEGNPFAKGFKPKPNINIILG